MAAEVNGLGGVHSIDRPVRKQWDLKALARHVGCIVALMWMPIVNGQPFIFPDTTSYVRAADLAVFLGSAGKISTEWTTRYEEDLKPGPTASLAPGQSHTAGGNDLRAGNIMSGRSPYFGSLLYMAYVTSGFWLFVIAQAAVCYALIVLAMRRVGLGRPGEIVVSVGALALGTGIAYYNGLLLADALAGFGIIAFMLLATDRGRLPKIERAFLFVIILISAVSHLTHILMLLGMMAALILLRWRRLANPSSGALRLGLFALILSIVSLYATSFAVRRIFGKPPQLVPLLTARFVEDGAGRDFISRGCDGQDFLICSVPLPPKISSQAFLWASDGPSAIFMSASPAGRARMAAEDTRFALAVWKAYPVRQTLAVVGNSVQQMLMFGADGLNQGCFDRPDCWESLPETFRAQLRNSLSGRLLWPNQFITIVYYTGAALALLIVILRLRAVVAKAPEEGRVLICWLILFGVAMAICDVLGGAISDPQYRYQGRVIWILPFLAIMTALIDRRTSAHAES